MVYVTCDEVEISCWRCQVALLGSHIGAVLDVMRVRDTDILAGNRRSEGAAAWGCSKACDVFD